MLVKTPGTIHPFDRATQVALVDGRWQGATSDSYWAFVGPFGGATGGALLRAIMVQPERAGDPLTMTVNFCALLAAGPFDLDVRLVKATRSTQHWLVELSQGGNGVAAFATAIFATRRPSWSHQQATRPPAPPFEQTQIHPDNRIAPWVRQYQFRFVEGEPEYSSTPHEVPAAAHSKLWISDATPRPVDFLSLLSFSDTFFARIFHARGNIVPIGTISMTVAFHADAEDLAAESAMAVLGVADAKIFHKSFSDQTGELWSPGGRLLATTSQVVYFKA